METDIVAKIGSIHLRLHCGSAQARKARENKYILFTGKPQPGLVPGILLQPKEAYFLKRLLSGLPTRDSQLLDEPTPEKLRTLDRHMDNIRCKLRECGAGLTVRRIHTWGYVLVPEEAEPGEVA